jgi:hypothetical protein
MKLPLWNPVPSHAEHIASAIGSFNFKRQRYHWSRFSANTRRSACTDFGYKRGWLGVFKPSPALAQFAPCRCAGLCCPTVIPVRLDNRSKIGGTSLPANSVANFEKSRLVAGHWLDASPPLAIAAA